MEGVVGAQRDKDISYIFRANKARVEEAGVSQHDRRDASLNFRHNKARLEISEEQA